jgi:hypothetical protein
MTSVRRLALAAATAAVAVLALSGCGSSPAGAAATLGDTRISDATLTAQVQEVLEAKGQPADSPDASLVQQTLGRMITIELLDTLAAREGVEVTQGQIDEEYANYSAQVGGDDALQELFLQENVAPSQLESIIRLQIQAQLLGIALAPEGSAEEQGTAVFEAAALLSEELDTTIAPRFGTWDPATLSLGPTPEDLAAPPALG